MRDIDVKQAIKEKNVQWIDVRSPREFAEATVPGAVNVPLFDNEERAEIGTIYKKQGKQAAIRQGMEIVSPKIPHLVDAMLEQSAGRTPLLFCWRGGMRSESMATFLDLAREPALRLEGGYRAYREHVVNRLENIPIYFRFVVLHGLTGVGKTALLHRIQDQEVPVLDLEGLAGHRGSAFGSLGETHPRNQRMFDALLLKELERYREEPYVFIEAESKRIGRVQLPDFMVKAKDDGIPVLVEASESSRVDHILDTYLQQHHTKEFQRQVMGAISRIERRLPPDTRKALWDWAERGEYRPLVRTLLTQYYDPRYQYSQARYQYVLHIQSDDMDQATAELVSFHHRLLKEQTALHP